MIRIRKSKGTKVKEPFILVVGKRKFKPVIWEEIKPKKKKK